MQAKKEMKVLLAASLKELVKKIPIEKITIKEITDQAGAIRPTFYYHFQDKYELIEWIISTEVFEPVRILFINGMYHEALVLIFTSIYKDREFYQAISHLEGQNSFESMVQRSIYRLLENYIDQLLDGKQLKHKWLTAAHLADYYSNTTVFVIIRWIQSGLSASPEEMVQIYEYIAEHSLHGVIQELSQ